MSKMKRIIFMGTPEFAVNPLEALYESNDIKIELVITGQDKKRSRNKFLPTPVKSKSIELGINTYEPENVNSEESLNKIKEIDPDFIVVIAFGQIIKDELLNEFKDRFINVHSSLLPKYRGASPMQWTILNKDKIAGISSMLISRKMDSGDILDNRTLEIDEDTNIEQLHDKLSEISRELIVSTILNFDNLYSNRLKQDKNLVSYSSKITKDMGHLDFNDKAEDIKSKIMAFYKWPGTYVIYNNTKMKIHSIDIIERYNGFENGKIIKVDKTGIYVNCLDACIVIKELQFEGKKRMDVGSYLLGNSIDKGVYLV